MDRSGDCGAPTGLPEPRFLFCKNSKNRRNFLQAESPQGRCAVMTAIHFARSVIHQQPVMQRVREAPEKFPAAARKRSDFLKIPDLGAPPVVNQGGALRSATLVPSSRTIAMSGANPLRNSISN
jgi:hypothetical protein